MRNIVKVLGNNVWVLLAVLVGVQVGLALLGTTIATDAVGDVPNVYKPWADEFMTGKWLGINKPWVYPFVAWAPMLLAKALSFVDYLTAWMLIAGALNVVAVYKLVTSAHRKHAYKAAWYFVLFLALLGPVAITRLDGISVSLVIIGVSGLSVYALSHGGTALGAKAATVWFVAATWIKVWPVALILAVLQKGKALKKQAIYLGVSLAIVLALAILLGANQNLFSFVTMQGSRGLQVESPIAMIWIWLGMFGSANGLVYFDTELITFQVLGDGVSQVAALMGAAMLAAILITCWRFVNGLRNGADARVLASFTALTATLDLIVFNKVGSPQYQLWLVAAVIMGLMFAVPKWRVPTLLTLVLAGLTQLIYPVYYDQITSMQIGGVMILTLRNLVMIYLLIWANYWLFRVSKRRVKTS